MAVAAQLLVEGRIATLRGTAGFGWVEALAIGHGRVLAAGSAADLEPLVGQRTRRLVLAPDEVALPGIVDAHLHLADAALSARAVDLEGLGLDAALERIAAAAAAVGPEAAWVLGGGWDVATLGRWPTARDLDAVAPGRRVLLWSHDRHAVWVSAPVLRAAGVDATTPDPPGGFIRRTGGEATGVLHETAAGLALPLVAPPARADLERAIETFGSELLGLGITGVHDPGGLEAPDLGADAIASLSDRGRLPIRVHRSVRSPDLDAAIARGRRTGDPLGENPRGRARMGWLKLFTDGALGSRTALLLEPYDGTHDRGIAVTDPTELADLARQAAAVGIVPQIHAIGDLALRHALDALEVIAPAAGPMARVEHVQFAHADDLPRFVSARIGASVQPVHLRSDAVKARQAWGDRAEERGYRARSLFDAGAVVAFGTDAPVEPPDPWPGLAIAVTRTFGPHERVDLAGALRAATIGPATLAGDPVGGRLLPGARADLIVVAAATVAEPVETGGPLGRTRPRLVLIDGEAAFER